MSKPAIYLGTPYTSPESSIREQRFKIASAMAAHLFNQGFIVYSPITSWHEVAGTHQMNMNWELWQEQDIWFLDKCDIMGVLCLPGWGSSVGLTAERNFAYAQGKEIHFYREHKIKQILEEMNVASLL